jgi:Glucosidase II beta subunit-like protein
MLGSTHCPLSNASETNYGGPLSDLAKMNLQQTNTVVIACTLKSMEQCRSTWILSNELFLRSLSLIMAVSLLLLSPCAASQDYHIYTDSFPDHDEYDMMALDPDTPYGTPYGGFSRATASRLASLPLKLPNVGEEIQEFEPMYTTVRDSFGRPFVCRVYHEDELDPVSLNDSMFNTPILKQEGAGNVPQPTNDNRDKNTGQEPAIGSASVASGTQVDSGSEGHNGGDARGVKSSEGGQQDSSIPLAKMDRIMFAQEIQKRLSRLSGLCAQIHPDWWSYEWCYDKKVTQFHINMESVQTGKSFDIQLEDITSLGIYSERRIIPFLEDIKPADPNAVEGLDFAEGRTELARVKDTFINGDICPDTGRPRVTESTLRCCSERILSKSKGGVLKNGKPVATDVVTIVHTTEWSEAVCHYNITLCTPLLCDDTVVIEASTDFLVKEKRTNKSGGINLELDPEAIEKMSIPEILQKTFGESGDFCIKAGTGGWWVYEFCPGDYIRQYHETTMMDRLSGHISTEIETQHILGRYVPEDHDWVTKENEWKNVVNSTEIGFGSGAKASSAKKGRSKQLPTKFGGNGAYFFQEYTKGDVCDHEDVTDSAIKAGAFGEGGIERATTVRYSCGTALDLNVKEDSTCHYIVDISVPTLCDHPLFKAPISKKQVVKCLPLQHS